MIHKADLTTASTGMSFWPRFHPPRSYNLPPAGGSSSELSLITNFTPTEAEQLQTTIATILRGVERIVS